MSSWLDPDLIETAMAYRGSDGLIKVRQLGHVVEKVTYLQSFAEIASSAWSLLVSDPTFSRDHDLERICSSVVSSPRPTSSYPSKISRSHTVLLLAERYRVRFPGRVVRNPGVPVGCVSSGPTRC